MLGLGLGLGLKYTAYLPPHITTEVRLGCCYVVVGLQLTEVFA